MMNLIKYVASATLCIAASAHAHADLLVIGHTLSSATPLKEKEVKMLFLNKPVKGFKGGKVQLILPPLDTDSGTLFLEEVVGMTPSRFQSYWSSQIFTGKGEEPTFTDSIEEVKRIMESNESAVAVIQAMDTPKNTKLLYRVTPDISDDTLAQLERLQALRDSGALTKSEYQAAKKRVLDTP